MHSLLIVLALGALPHALPFVQNPPTPEIQSEPGVAELVLRGRSLIASGQGDEAHALLAKADNLNGGQLSTRIWLARALIEQGLLNDALDMADDLAGAGHTGAGVDYIYGMAFAGKARKYIAEGLGGSMVAINFGDAVNYLMTATEADAQEYADAFFPLADSAWNSQRLDVARAAAEQALKISGDGVAENFMLGDIAFSQFIVANADETLVEAANAHWQTAYDAFGRAAAVVVAEDDSAGLRRSASAHKKMADALLWKSRKAEASTEYAIALGIDPNAVAFDQILNSLGREGFVQALDQGSKNFDSRHSTESTDDATLLWWLGWALFDAGEYERSKAAFELCFTDWPAYTNCKWYIALCNYHMQDQEGALTAMLEAIQIDAVGLYGSVQGDIDRNLRILDSLVGYSFSQERILDAARLSAVQANSAGSNPRYWNNMGLFYRDAGDKLARTEGQGELRMKYYERALEGYEHALSFDPTNPALLNDTAVVLHYNLDREFARVKEMYITSNELAQDALAREDLNQDLRDLYTTAKRDSANNLMALEILIRKRRLAAEREADPSEG
ncbi:MAG: tetratricopeptide (TPR) repeat protein [Planctomycetota bacterium]|jgi:tetratricopeptide (TPR) repeat protein